MVLRVELTPVFSVEEIGHLVTFSHKNSCCSCLRGVLYASCPPERESITEIFCCKKSVDPHSCPEKFEKCLPVQYKVNAKLCPDFLMFLLCPSHFVVAKCCLLLWNMLEVSMLMCKLN